jgi:hypothetical protein
MVLSGQTGSPIEWPVGLAAEGLAGAAVMESHGSVRYEGGVTTPRERVLLVAGVLAAPLGLYDAAEHAGRCGVRGVLVAGIRVTGVDTSQFIDAFA